jgi:glycine/D-amino acid oxidase-like deaminating enzyme/nitrite reductase/ring-hydroxylating ferredoxin subunit
MSSVWRTSFDRRTPPAPALRTDRTVDVVVVGAGITGMTLALLLMDAGLEVAVLERLELGAGTTGATTAHLTEALDIDYATLIARFGEDAARAVARSVRAGIGEIERRSAVSGRDTGFRRLPGFRWADRSADLDQLEREAEAAAKIGLDVQLVWDVPLPFATAGALRFPDQAEIHPLVYLDVLAQGFLAGGGQLYEATPVVDVSGKHVTVASGHRVEASYVVDATHTPIGTTPSIQARVFAMTSYVLALQLAEPLGDGLFWDLDDPYHYVRAVGPLGDRILVGGGDHHTGRADDPTRALRELEEWARRRFPVESVERRWSGELFEPADGLPYIGALPTDRTRFVAAGFSGTGLTFGTVAALLIRDLVTEGGSPLEDVYAAGRMNPLVSGGTVARENARIAWRFVADRLRRADESSRELPPGEGRIERSGGRQVAVFRDQDGVLHRLSPRCRHLGCMVAWNPLEQTWDCPCHGGRYRGDGTVLYGPPTQDLEPVDDAQHGSSVPHLPRSPRGAT